MSLVLEALTPQTRRQTQLELEQIGVFQRQPRPSVQLTGAVEPQRGPMGKARGTADHQSTHGKPPLSGLAELDHKIKGLGFGADDFLTKPFDRRELIARIQAIVRRSKGHSESTIRTGKLVVNLDTRVVSVDDQPVHLTGKEYGILELLSLRKGTTLTKEMFLNHLYGGMDEPELKIIDVFVCKLRKKLAQATGGKHYIETVWGRGYVLRDPIEAPPPVISASVPGNPGARPGSAAA